MLLVECRGVHWERAVPILSVSVQLIEVMRYKIYINQKVMFY